MQGVFGSQLNKLMILNICFVLYLVNISIQYFNLFSTLYLLETISWLTLSVIVCFILILNEENTQNISDMSQLHVLQNNQISWSRCLIFTADLQYGLMTQYYQWPCYKWATPTEQFAFCVFMFQAGTPPKTVQDKAKASASSSKEYAPAKSEPDKQSKPEPKQPTSATKRPPSAANQPATTTTTEGLYNNVVTLCTSQQ